MSKPAAVLLAILAWAVFGSWAEARRSSVQKDLPALRPGIEADLAARHCPDLRIDTERFRAFSHDNHLNHADFFTQRRSAALQREVNAQTKALRDQPAQTCARLWERYGSEGTETVLLARR